MEANVIRFCVILSLFKGRTGFILKMRIPKSSRIIPCWPAFNSVVVSTLFYGVTSLSMVHIWHSRCHCLFVWKGFGARHKQRSRGLDSPPSVLWHQGPAEMCVTTQPLGQWLRECTYGVDSLGHDATYLCRALCLLLVSPPSRPIYRSGVYV